MRKGGSPMTIPAYILIINAGSSSIKFAAYTDDQHLTLLADGQVERIGTPRAVLTAHARGSAPSTRRSIRANSHAAAASHVLTWIQTAMAGYRLVAAGHRVVFGGSRLIRHQKITAATLKELKRDIPLDPSHLPRDIALIHAVAEKYPTLSQYACFDTAFHHAMPQVAKLLPIPWKYYRRGVQRLGFHGISFEFLISSLARIAPAEAQGRVVVAHLGSGASLAAVHHGKPINTTMGFTPAGGLVMASRTGDLDPGVLLHLMERENLSPREMEKWITEQCGLRGVSQRTGDIRDLLRARRSDPRAAAALELFCHSARQWIAAMTASMGGVDTLIFSGGIGEHAWQIRREICHKLGFLGIHLDARANRGNHAVISRSGAAVTVRVIATDEQIQMARIVRGLLQGRGIKPKRL
jgi:acetate kinase